MAAALASPWTLETVARALAQGPVFAEPPFWDTAQKRGISIDHLRLHYEGMLLKSREGTDTAFWLRWTETYYSFYTPEDPLLWAHRFVRQEFRYFCHPPGQRAWQRHQLLSGLIDVQTLHSAPAAVRLRLLELCFFPGVLFPWVVAWATFVKLVRAFNLTNRRRLAAHAHACERFARYVVNHPVPRHYRDLMTVLKQVFTDTAIEGSQVETWHTQLGIAKNVSVSAQRHHIWTSVFVEMIELLRPFCSGPKYAHLKEPGTMPEEVYDKASQLMALSQPALWTHSRTRVKNRYVKYREQHPIV